jgi:hypothetical protein
MRKFNTMLVIALSFVGFSAFADEVEANDSKEVAVEVEATEAAEASDSAEVASEVEVESSKE